MCGAAHAQENSWGIRAGMNISNLDRYSLHIITGGISVKKNHADKALEIYEYLSKYFMVSYDETANIGKRYRRADAIGTPWCITVDDETINNGTITLRDRDTMEQITLPLDEVKDYVLERIKF